MANEITLTIAGTLINSGLKRTFTPGAVSITQNAKLAWASTWLVGLTAEDMAPVDVGSNGGILFLRNLLEEDPSNPDGNGYVTYGPSDGGTLRNMGRIKPGEAACFRLGPSVTLRAIATGIIVPLDVMLFAD